MGQFNLFTGQEGYFPNIPTIARTDMPTASELLLESEKKLLECLPTQDQETQVNHSVKDLFNVPLVDFDDLRLICGEDRATVSYEKSVGDDIPSESVNVDTSEIQEMSVWTQSNSRRAKRSRPWEEAFSRIDGLTEQVEKQTEVVISSDQHADQNFCDKVYGVLMTFKGEDFGDDLLKKAF